MKSLSPNTVILWGTGAGNSMCGFGGRHNLTLSSSSWGSGSDLWAASQKKKRSFPGRCRRSHLDTANQGRGCPKKLCLRAPWSQPSSASGGFSKGPGGHGAKRSVVPLECKPWSTDWKTRMLRPQVQWGQSVSIAPEIPPPWEKPRGLGGPVTKLPNRRAEGLHRPLTLKQAGQGEAVSDPLLLPLQEGREWTQGGQDQVKPAFLKPRVIKPHAELLNTQMSRHLFLRN